MTEELVMSTHREVFYKALLDQDWPTLANLYADDYTLIRSDGSMLGKDAVLSDLATGGLVFRSIELTNARVRLAGEAAVLTGDSHTTAERRGSKAEAFFRLTAVYVERNSCIHLLHFQSTPYIPSLQ